MSSSYDVIVVGSGAGGGTAIRVGDHIGERLGAQQPQPEPAHVA